MPVEKTLSSPEIPSGQARAQRKRGVGNLAAPEHFAEAEVVSFARKMFE